jgi:hypothetical protein
MGAMAVVAWYQPHRFSCGESRMGQ